MSRDDWLRVPPIIFWVVVMPLAALFTVAVFALIVLSLSPYQLLALVPAFVIVPAVAGIVWLVRKVIERAGRSGS